MVIDCVSVQEGREKLADKQFTAHSLRQMQFPASVQCPPQTLSSLIGVLCGLPHIKCNRLLRTGQLKKYFVTYSNAIPNRIRLLNAFAYS